MNIATLQEQLQRVFGSLPTSLIVGVVVLIVFAIVVRVISQAQCARLPQYVRKPLMSENELDFLRQFRAICPSDIVVCPQVALSALIDVADHVVERRAARNGYAQCFADFVICRAETYDVLGIIELDDRTHTREHRRKRDQRLDAIYGMIGLPVVHVAARKTGRYTTRDAEQALSDLRRQSAPSIGS
ncbi:MAG: DUF2726 domain-containing protein [Pirellulales bacterium]